ncbi:MAG TPA: serine acetyltransferase [Bacteroidales bacterium]|nr:serine acetyltransferase [Bacteroidales bacterium]
MSIPDLRAIERLIGNIFDFMFPVGDDLKTDETLIPDESLRFQLESILEGSISEKKDVIADNFLGKLPSIKKKLIKDAEFILDSDPAATGLIEVVSIYPGFYAIFCYRIANCLIKMQVPLIPRIITEHAHSRTGIDIHPGASIGCPFSIDHGTGIVIGETTKIGHKVKLYQGVTLGALSVAKNKASKKRHPTIEDNVIIYAGSTILGGETVVGRNTVIGGNVWLTESVAPFSIVYHKSEIVVRDHSHYNEPVNFII